MVPHFQHYDEVLEADNIAAAVPDFAGHEEIPPAVVNHGQAWYDEGEVGVDVGISHRRTRLLWPGNPNDPHGHQPLRPMLEYFKLMYPMILNQSMLEHTNAMLAKTRNSPTNIKEMFKYFGMRLNMTLDRTCVNIPDYWMTEETEGSTFVPPNYGRFVMTRHRFQTLSRCMRFDTFDEGVVNEVRESANN
jgi:Transposase IS4